MNLNDVVHFKKLDPENMIGFINGLPDQLLEAWELGQKFELPKWGGIEQVVIQGMGGSAIGGDLLAAYVADQCEVPVVVHRDYDSPKWAKGEKTLAICSSYSGNTEETLSGFEAARKAGCRILAVTTDGKLTEMAKKERAALWKFDLKAQPRAAVGYSFGLLLAAFTRLGLVADPGEELRGAVEAMKRQQEKLRPEVPDTQNPAKRMAGQFMGRWITIYGAGRLGVVARRWKTQINEIAKAQAQFEALPEADHNTLQGTMFPEELFGATMHVFLRAASDHPRNQLRSEFTRSGIMLQGQNTDFVASAGEGPLADMWTLLHYGDYTAYYLAMAYEVDPSPVPMLAELKEKLGGKE